MTPSQLRVLDLVRERITGTGYAPTIREIVAVVGGGVGGVHKIVDDLVAAGHLARSVGEVRGLRLVDMPNLRVVGTAALRAELARRGVTMEALMPRETKAVGRWGARSVTCAADTCGNAVRPGMLMCRTHWFALPRDLQDRIKQTFARRDVDAYQAAVTTARDLIDGGSWGRRA